MPKEVSGNVVERGLRSADFRALRRRAAAKWRCLKSPRENAGEAISLPSATQKYLKKLDESEQISNSSNFSNDSLRCTGG